MTQYTKPTVLPAWAESAGDADVLQPSGAEIQAGWPLSNVPPSRKRFNWVLKYLAQGVRYLLQRGIPEWDAAEDYRINDRVMASDGKTYKCIQAGTNKNPTTQTAYWTRWGFTLAELDAEGTTPAQFDNSVKRASTAFVKNSGLQINNIKTVNATATLQAADLGGEIVCNGSAYTLTLPVTSGLGAGAYGQLLIISNVATGNISVAGNGSDRITCGINSSSSFVLQPGDRAFLILSSPGFWILVGGEASLKYSGTFGASLGSAGWRKLPSGEIEQWGTVTLSAVGNYNTQVIGGTTFYTHYYQVAYPIAFPSATYEIECTIACNTGTDQNSMAGYTASANLHGWGSPLTSCTIAVTSPNLGWVPTIHYRVRGK